MKPTATLIPAAGASTRLGFPKQLLAWNETTLLRDTLLKVLELQTDPIVVVLGSNFEVIRDSISDLPVTIVHNEDWEQGMGSSLARGMQYILHEHPEAEHVLITLCDLPLVQTKHYQRMLEMSNITRDSIVATQFEELTGVPVILPEMYFSEIIKLKGDTGARKIIASNSGNVVVIPSEIPFTDVDTTEAYEALLRDHTSEKK